MWVIGGLVALIVLLSLYVYVTAGRNLLAARQALDLSVQEVDESSVIEAETHLIEASRQLRSLPARLLGFVPVARQNLRSLRVASDAAVPTVSAAIDLQRTFAALEEQGLVRSERVDVALLERLRGPVAAEAEALENLVRELDGTLGGWLLPPVWERLYALRQNASDLLDGVRDAERILANSGALLGAEEPRNYLVLLVNNAELRGAGGVLTGVGTVQLNDGKLSLGRFRSVHALRERPPEKVPAPPEFVRRFGIYKADTTLWLNATFSPDFPDVALVASRLYEETTGVATDGALMIDPRGLAAMVDPDSSFEVPRLDRQVTGKEIAAFTYSDVYESFDNQVARRAALLKLGEDVFKSFISDPLVGRERFAAIGAAVTGGHIRMQSFGSDEAAVLDEVGLSGTLEPPGDAHVVRVTQQNFGSANGEGTKLDYWTERRVDQACSVSPDRALCHTSLRLDNDIPEGLPTYVAGSPYGVLRSYVEIYLPGDSEVEAVESNGEPAEFRTEGQAGYQVVSVYYQLDPLEVGELRIRYSLPVEDSFHLRLEPQPLASDATLDVAVVAPDGWTVQGSGQALDLEQPWDRAIEVEVAPDPRSGLSALWKRLFGGS